uniref:Uncharacterized protein n=1 Tax=Triticum urartu TaxID=4572 RepID=A0A8R7PHS7_TRIUA
MCRAGEENCSKLTSGPTSISTTSMRMDSIAVCIPSGNLSLPQLLLLPTTTSSPPPHHAVSGQHADRGRRPLTAATNTMVKRRCLHACWLSTPWWNIVQLASG